MGFSKNVCFLIDTRQINKKMGFSKNMCFLIDIRQNNKKTKLGTKSRKIFDFFWNSFFAGLGGALAAPGWLEDPGGLEGLRVAKALALQPMSAPPCHFHNLGSNAPNHWGMPLLPLGSLGALGS